MELKKSERADLEKKKGIFLGLGFVVALSMLLLAFEWGTKLSDESLLDQMEVVEIEEEMIITRMESKPPPPPPPPPVVVEVLNIVEDDVEIDEFEMESNEVDADMDIEPVFFEEEEEAAEEEVFVIVEDMPTFRGGNLNDFRNYIQKNLKYPEIAAENGIQGKVFIQFAVDSKGQVVDVKVVRGVDPALDAEAKRAVIKSPKWSPGKQRGRPVKVKFTFPISFVLQ